MSKPAIRKHSARVIKARNAHDGKMEAFALVAGTFRYIGWQRFESADEKSFGYHMLEHSNFKGLLDNSDFDAKFVEYNFGKPIKQLLSKSFILEWTTSQHVYGVPF